MLTLLVKNVKAENIDLNVTERAVSYHIWRDKFKCYFTVAHAFCIEKKVEGCMR